MRRLNLLIAILAAGIIPLGGLMGAAPAMAYDVTAVYKQCEGANGQLTGHFSRAQLQAALNELPSEVSEYSDCQDLIQQALLHDSSHSKGHNTGANGTGGGGGGSGSNGSGGKGPAGGTGNGGTSLGKNGKSGSGGGNSVSLAGSGIRPGSTGSGGGSSSLPVALVVVLVLLALTAVSGGVVMIRRRVDARQGT